MDHFFLDDKGLRHLLERINYYFASQSSLSEETRQRTEKDSNLLTALETNVSSLQGGIQSEETARTLADSNLSNLIKSIYNKDDDTEIESGVLLEKISDVLSRLESEEQSRLSEDRSLSDSIKSIYKKDSDTLVESGVLIDKINETNDSIGSLDSSLSSVAKSGDYTDLTNKPNLATVATSGSYTDLSDKPSIPAAQVNSDWDAVSGVAQILNKPTLATVATSGDYTDLTNKPNLATVATSGSYNDLTDIPTIPGIPTNVSDFTNDAGYITQRDIPTEISDFNNDAGYITADEVPAQVNSDWNSDSGASQILNKPSLAAVATSGSYNDLSDTPTIPTNVSDLNNDSGFITSWGQADWNQTDNSEPDYIKNKPTIPTVPTNVSDFINDAGYITQNDIPTDISDFNNDAGYITLEDVPERINADWNAVSGSAEILHKPNLATVATSGDYNDLTNKPTIPATPVQSNWNENDTNSLAYIQNKPTIPAAQVNADWNSTSGVSEILHKPSLAAVATSGDYTDLSNTPTIPTVNDSTITFTQGGTTKGTITLNQNSGSTIDFDATNPELENTVEDIDDRLSDLEEILEQYDLDSVASKTLVNNTVNAAETRINSNINSHKNDKNNPHSVTYNQVGLEVIEDIESEPEEPENPDPSEEPDYKYIASIDYVKQYVSDKGIGLETLSDLEGTGREGVLYIYNETLYIWEEGEEEEEGEGEFVAVSTASSGVSHEIEEKVNTSYSHTFDTITNPHNITKGTLGLGNVNNTSDIDKPLSNAAIIELARKVNVAEIVDNLTTQSSVTPLSANMGYELSSQIAALELEVNSIGSALRFKGTVPSRSDLSNVQNPEPGDCYQIVSVDGQDPDEGHMFSYTSSNTWVEISGSFGIDFVAATMNEVQSIIDSYQRPNSNQNENNQTGESEETGDGEDNGQTGEGGEGENDGQESEPVVDPNAEPSGN